MTGLDTTLLRLVETEQARGNVHGLVLHVRSADGRLDFMGAAGAADPDIRFPIASVSKMFTAALIVQLCDEGALDLDQSVQSALPGVDLTGLHVVKGIDYGPKLTIRQLLFQTSGLADYYEGGVARDLIRSKDYIYRLGDVLDWAKARPPHAAPDSGRAHYSDTNFQLLGAVIEAACGMSYGDAVQARICAPLGLTRTALYDASRDGDGQTLPVWHEAKRLAIPGILSSMGPDGGIVSDTDDLMTFLRTFTEGRLFRPENMSALHRWRKMQFPLQVRRWAHAVQAARLDDAVAAFDGADRAFRGQWILCLSRTGAGHVPRRHLQPDRCAEASLQLHAAGAEGHRDTWGPLMLSILKWLSVGIAGLIALVVILFVATRGDYAVAALVTEDGTLPSRQIADVRLHMRTLEGPPDAQTIVVLHGGAGGNSRSLLGLSGPSETHRVVF